MAIFREILRRLAPHHPRAASLYRRFARPNGRQWAEYLKQQGRLFHLGENCSILPSASFVDPEYTWIGNRACIGNSAFICHDGAIEMLQQRFGLRIDRVAPIIIHDDVYIGEGALILGGTTIGEGSIIGAGSVLRRKIPAGSVVMGNPAKVVARVEDLMRIWEAESQIVPWAHLIAGREGAFDADLEPKLRELRQKFFFGDRKV